MTSSRTYPDGLNYVLITPARNEARFIDSTIKSVIDQTLKPMRWIIVSDGSTDGTDQIVEKYTSANPWIELVAVLIFNKAVKSRAIRGDGSSVSSILSGRR